MIGLLLFALCGGGGFYAIHAGLLSKAVAAFAGAPASAAKLPDITFVPVHTLVVSVGEGATARHLKFTSSLEVSPAARAEVSALLPRILDVMNGYLRAVDPASLEDPSALVRLRAQLLRRIQLVTGDGRVRDLLVTEFVLD